MEILLLIVFAAVVFVIFTNGKKSKYKAPQSTMPHSDIARDDETKASLQASPLEFKASESYKTPKSIMPDPGIFRHYEAKRLLTNSSELAFFYALVRAMPPHFYLLAKPRLEDVIGVKKDLNPKLKFQLRGRVKSRHIDFLVIDWNGAPICGIELDGKSHKNEKARAGDTLKDGIFAASGIPLHRVIVGQNFAQTAQNIFAQLTPVNPVT